MSDLDADGGDLFSPHASRRARREPVTQPAQWSQPQETWWSGALAGTATAAPPRRRDIRVAAAAHERDPLPRRDRSARTSYPALAYAAGGTGGGTGGGGANGGGHRGARAGTHTTERPLPFHDPDSGELPAVDWFGTSTPPAGIPAAPAHPAPPAAAAPAAAAPGVPQSWFDRANGADNRPGRRVDTPAARNAAPSNPAPATPSPAAHPWLDVAASAAPVMPVGPRPVPAESGNLPVLSRRELRAREREQEITEAAPLLRPRPESRPAEPEPWRPEPQARRLEPELRRPEPELRRPEPEIRRPAPEASPLETDTALPAVERSRPEAFDTPTTTEPLRRRRERAGHGDAPSPDGSGGALLDASALPSHAVSRRAAAAGLLDEDDDLPARDTATRDSDGDDDHDAVPRWQRWLVWGLRAGAAVVAALAAVTLLPTTSTLAAAAATLAPVALAPAALLVTLAVRFRLHVAAAVTAAAALLPWAMVAGYVVAASPAPEEGATHLRVMTLNGHHGRAEAASVVETATAHQADVVVITELSDVLAHDLTTAGLSRLVSPAWFSAPGEVGRLGIWSRYPLVDVAPVAGTTWPAVRVVIQTGTRQVTIVAGHAAQPLPRRFPYLDDAAAWQRDLRLLGDAAGPGRGNGPRLLIGDLNATPWHPAYRDVLARTGLEDGADALGRGMRPTWPAWGPLAVSPLDHVLVGGGMGVFDMGTAKVTGSDHRALVADLAVPRP